MGEDMPWDGAAARRGEPDRLGFGDEVADRQNQPVLADQNTAAGALPAERAGGESVLRDRRPQAEYCAQREVQIESAISRLWLDLVRYFPIYGSRHLGASLVATLFTS
jgi:hypothetical protein